MKLAAYSQSQAVTLDGERAFEELYARLARWTEEAASSLTQGDWSAAEAELERSITLLGYMDTVIDVSHNYEIAAAILNLHRFAIGTLVRAKVEHKPSVLDGLPSVFVSLCEIFQAIRRSNVTH